MSKRARGVSETVMQTLWRQAVRQRDMYCVLRDSECFGPLEAHHIKRRAIACLRHDERNGALLCQHHHGKMQYEAWRMKLREAIGEARATVLDTLEQVLFPAFLAKRNQTRNEYLLSQKQHLITFLGRDD